MQRRPALSLIELVFALATTTLVMTGLASMMILVGKAAPGPDSVLSTTIQGALAVDQLADDLYFAQSVYVRSPTAIEFQIDDRDKDNLSETIRYEWSGSGGPLRRRLNNGLWSNVLDRVINFDLTYDAVANTSSIGTSTESAETILSSHTTFQNQDDWVLKDKNWIGQCFIPALPANATSWKITRIRLYTRVHGGNAGINRIQIQPAASGRPSGILLDEAILWENQLADTYLWQDIYYTSGVALSPSSAYCLIIQWIKDVDSADFRFRGNNAGLTTSNMITTLDGGATWTTYTSQSLMYEVFGQYSAPSVIQPLPVTYLAGVRIQLQCGSGSDSNIDTRIPILNEPQL